MKRITANTTLEDSAFPISFSNITTTVTGLACKMTIDKNHSLANHFSFVLDKSQKLLCAPATNKPSGFLPDSAFSFHVSSSQFFKGDSIAIFVNNCFRDAMIHISDEPSLSPCQFLQMSFGGASACSLKASLQMLISSLDFTKLFAVEKGIIASDCWVVDSPINTNNFLDFPEFWSTDFCYYVKKYFPFFGSDSRRIRLFEVIPFKIMRYFDSILLSAIDCAYADHLRIWEKPECVMIKPDRRMLLLSGLLLKPEPFEHITGLVSDSSNKAAIEFRVGFPDEIICKMMKPSFVESLGFHPNIYTFLASLIAQTDCSYQVIVSDDFRSDCYLHNNPLKHNLFIYVVVLSPYENQKNKTFSLQHQLSFGVVSKVPKESFSRGSEGFNRENNQRSLHIKRLGTYQFVNTTRPSARFCFYFSNIQPNVCSQGFEGSNSSEGSKRVSVCQEILESELLCRDSWNSNRTDYSEVYSRTRKEVKC